ncbi:MAG: PrgI family protein [Candidatus Buchananbacteria bacterium]
MQQVTVPQFLDVEDKIIGPITIRQFIELMIGCGIIFIFYKVFDFSLFVVSGLFIIAVTLMFAFVRINGQAFHLFLLNLISTFKSPKLKIWKKKISTKEIIADLKSPKEVKMPIRTVAKKTATSSKLSELSLIVDTGGVYTGEN